MTCVLYSWGTVVIIAFKNYSAVFWLHLKLIFTLLKLSPFFRGTEMLHLAVLHSRKLCVYSVSGKNIFFS